jgi:long-chain acyl-CoA synthetase
MLRGVAVIPLDARASPELAGRSLAAASPRVLLIDGDREPPASSLPVWRLSDIEWVAVRRSANTPRATVTPDTVAEIVFTSGTNGDPKGVVITHRNIIANIIPIERAVARYHRYIWVLSPLRFLGLLPLSHMFGQALGIFLPPLVTATTVFISGYNPDEIVRQIRRQRITLVVTIPRMLDLLRARVTQLVPRLPRKVGGLMASETAALAISAGAQAPRLAISGVRRWGSPTRRRARSVLASVGLRRSTGLRPHRDGADRGLERSLQDEARHGRRTVGRHGRANRE